MQASDASRPAGNAAPDGSPFSEWERFAEDCDKAAGESERLATLAKTDIERTRWRSHADNFAATSRRTREILANKEVDRDE